VFKGVHVFMQYFTLYDIKARGFVRPFCFGYVSKDHVKLDKILSKIIVRFDKVRLYLFVLFIQKVYVVSYSYHLISLDGKSSEARQSNVVCWGTFAVLK